MSHVSTVEQSGADAGFKAKFGWVMYDWAAQPFFTVITTFVFSPYFVNHVAATPAEGQSLWGLTQSLAGLALAITAPFLGSLADRTGPRKPWVYSFSALCIIACMGLYFAVPGASGDQITLIMACVIAGTIGAEFSIVFTNAMLPSLARYDRLGRLSGYGWAMGYIGGLLALVLILWMTGQLPGVPGPDLGEAPKIAERLSGPFSGLWFLVFLLPFIFWTPDEGKKDIDRSAIMREGASELWATIKTLPSYPDMLTFLIARMIYYDGLNAIFAFGGIYAAHVFGWATIEIGLFGLIILITGILGSLLGGVLDDIIGSKRTLIWSVTGLLLTSIGILSIADGKILFVMETSFPVEGDGLFASTAELFLILVAALLGIVAGPAQAASRSMVVRLAPQQDLGKFFGLYAFSGKATSFVAPAVIAAVTVSTGSVRAGTAMLIIFIVVGLFLLLRVDEDRGHALAKERTIEPSA